MENSPQDLTGHRFGGLTALDRIPDKKPKRSDWLDPRLSTAWKDLPGSLTLMGQFRSVARDCAHDDFAAIVYALMRRPSDPEAYDDLPEREQYAWRMVGHGIKRAENARAD